jgi:hypothetical protein
MSEQSWTDHPRLWAWLREREEAFPPWAADHPGGWDFSVASLDQLMATLRTEFSSWEDITAARDTLAVTVPAWYFGEVCVRAGAVWKHTYASPIDAPDWPGPFVGVPGDPAENPGYELPPGVDTSAPAVHPVTTVCGALMDDDAEWLREFVAEFEEWQLGPWSERVTNNPRLHAWLQEQEKGFPQWAANHPGFWDFSPESVDRLQTALATEFSSWEEIRAAQHTPAITVPAWYFGEVCVRAGAVWKYHPEPLEDPDNLDDPEPDLGPRVGVPGDPMDDPDYEDPYDDEVYVPAALPIFDLSEALLDGSEGRLRRFVEEFDTWRRDAGGENTTPSQPGRS